MTTRIILHGGNSSKKSHKNERFFREIVDGIDKETIQILCVYFARPEGRWEDSHAVDQSIFRALGIDLGLEIETELAAYDLDEFVRQINDSDVIFINGGMRGHLKDTLLKIGVERFRQMIQGKTLVGISAGANILSKYYYSMVTGGIREGIGLLDIKLLTHYSEESSDQLTQLKIFRQDLPLVTIAEEEYVTYEIA